MNDRLKNLRPRRPARQRRTLRAPRGTACSPVACGFYASDAAGATATAPAAAPAVVTSTATLLTRHILRDGEIVLLIVKPSLWTIFFNCLPALAVALIVILSTILWAPHHAHLGIEAGFMLVACCAAWAILAWTGRLYLLTDLRIVRIVGIFNPQVHDIPLRKVARTRLVASFHERLWRLGSIEIIPESDHWPWSVWQTIARPRQIHETIVRAIARAKQGGCYGNGY